jgi:N-acyl-D-amino-acid deacylase
MLFSSGRFLFLIFIGYFLCQDSRAQPVSFDIILRQGTIYDGSGHPPFIGDVGIRGDTIASVGDLSNSSARREVSCHGLAIAPGFINMLSWADGSLLKDGRSMSDIKQGVTLEIFGEGWSPGPRKKRNSRDTLWTTLGGYFETLHKRGVSPNYASFVGATTVRDYVIGRANRAPTAQELKQMKTLVANAMKEGAMGVGASLIYAPADYASTEELIELCKTADEYGGMYITHMRSESDHILKALNETFTIAKEATIPTEIYHLKINQQWNWPKVDTVLFKIDSAQRAGLVITANMYPYTASATSLTARIPTWVQEGGASEMRKQLRTPAIRQRVLQELASGIPSKNSDPKNVMIIGFRKDSLNRLYLGKRLDEIARLHGKSADETMLDLLLADKSSIPAIFFLISEENVQRMLRLPYVSLGSDAASLALTKQFLDMGTHPRAYGTFSRFLGHYVRDLKLMSMAEAIRRMTSLPASNLKIRKRGFLKMGYFADVVVFDPGDIMDLATYEKPHQYARGMIHVFVNGTQVLDQGEHTGATPGRCVRGPGYRQQ